MLGGCRAERGAEAAAFFPAGDGRRRLTAQHPRAPERERRRKGTALRDAEWVEVGHEVSILIRLRVGGRRRRAFKNFDDDHPAAATGKFMGVRSALRAAVRLVCVTLSDVS